VEVSADLLTDVQRREAHIVDRRDLADTIWDEHQTTVRLV